jgi:hypothetical protein
MESKKNQKLKSSKKVYNTKSNLPKQLRENAEVKQYEPVKGFFKMDLATKQTYTNPKAWQEHLAAKK